LVVSTLTSCKKWIETDDSKINPNAAVDAPASAILTHILTATIAVNEGNNARFVNMFTQHFRGIGRQHDGYDSYILSSQSFAWGVEYQEIIHQANLIITKADVAKDKALSGIAKVVKAWTFGGLTALYGDIPFTEADKFETAKNPKSTTK
jgi:hypothetical protein